MWKSIWTFVPLYAAILSGCPGSDEPPAKPTPPSRTRDTLVIAAPEDAKNLLYIVSTSLTDNLLSDALSLQTMYPEFDCSLKFTPGSASSWEFSAEGTSITVHLREGLSWSDGTPLTAEDFRFTYDLVADPQVGSRSRDVVKYMKPDARPAVVDAHTLRFDFDHEFDHAAMLSAVAIPPVPKHLLEGVDRANLASHPLNSTAPVTSGPWKVAQWKREEALTLIPDPTFAGPKQFQPRLNKVVFKVVKEYATRLAELQTGAVDLVYDIRPSDADRLRSEHPELLIRRRGWRNEDLIAWNRFDPADYARVSAEIPAGQKQRMDPSQVKPNPLFADSRVRRALAEAVNVDRFLKDLLTSQVTGDVYGRAAVGPISPAFCGAHNDSIVPIRYDLASAAAHLAELGWADTNGDGTLDKDGVPFRFTLLTNSGNPRREAVAQILQADLKSIGIEMDIAAMELTTVLERLKRRDYDAALTGASVRLPPDPRDFWGRDADNNYVGYDNPRVDELIAAGLAELDPEKAKPIWWEFQKVLYEDQPVTSLFWIDQLVAVHSRFQNSAIDILAPYHNLEQWSVPVDKVRYPD